MTSRSNVHSIAQALEDSAALVDVARKAGITAEQAEKCAAALAVLPVVQVIRICVSAQTKHMRQQQRMIRKGR